MSKCEAFSISSAALLRFPNDTVCTRGGEKSDWLNVSARKSTVAEGEAATVQGRRIGSVSLNTAPSKAKMVGGPKEVKQKNDLIEQELRRGGPRKYKAKPSFINNTLATEPSGRFNPVKQ